MTTGRKQQDVALWRAWKANPSKENLNKLLKQLDPLIMSQVRNWSGTVADSRLKIRARILAKEALSSYNPSKGALSTHITTRLQKLSRDVYPYQNAARLPEHQQIKYRTYHTAIASFEDKHGRKPNTSELADSLAWSTKQVNSYEGQLRGDFVTSAGVVNDFYEEGIEDRLVLDYVYHDLDNQEKELFKYITGYQGAPTLSNAEIMARMQLTQGQLSYLKRKLIKRVNDYRKRFGS